MVRKNGFESFIILREEQCLEDGVSCVRFELLVDDLENGEICNLVSAEMDEMGNELRGKNSAALRECASVEEPGKEECTVGVCGQLNTVKGNGSSKHALLILGGVMTLEAGSHGSGTVSSLGNLPHLAEHRLEDEVIVRRLEFQAALQNVVSILIEEQRNSVWLEIGNNHTHLFGSLAYVDNLLCRPSSVLMYANFGHVRSDLREHGVSHII